jgi:4-oxalocrotonate tautomerase
MPLIFVEGPAVPVETKRKLATELTEAAARIYGIPDITIVIKENPADCISLNGTLICDLRAKKE